MTSIQTKNPQPRNLLLAILGGLFLLIFIAPPTYAQTETPSSITLNADVGLDGYCISDKWLPVRVTLENNGTNQEGFVEVNVNDGVNNWHFSEQISLPAVSRKEVTIYAYVYGSPSNLSVAFINEAGTVVKEIPRSLNCLSGGTTLIGVW
ncbi:MAG TPA: hypothetical protein PK530_24680, partial [Anaerolineales bacterium]|nr:hypothetical protein [Anaerolineales bacterium]